MKVVFTKEELENFKKGNWCAAIDCGGYICSRCPIEPYLEDRSLEEAVQFIEEHLEK